MTCCVVLEAFAHECVAPCYDILRLHASCIASSCSNIVALLRQIPHNKNMMDMGTLLHTHAMRIVGMGAMGGLVQSQRSRRWTTSPDTRFHFQASDYICRQYRRLTTRARTQLQVQKLDYTFRHRIASPSTKLLFVHSGASL